jgi:hypothetical protein
MNLIGILTLQERPDDSSHLYIKITMLAGGKMRKQLRNVQAWGE